MVVIKDVNMYLFFYNWDILITKRSVFNIFILFFLLPRLRRILTEQNEQMTTNILMEEAHLLFVKKKLKWMGWWLTMKLTLHYENFANAAILSNDTLVSKKLALGIPISFFFVLLYSYGLLNFQGVWHSLHSRWFGVGWEEWTCCYQRNWFI